MSPATLGLMWIVAAFFVACVMCMFFAGAGDE